MKKSKDIPWKYLFALIGVHIFMSLIFILISQTDHPLLSLLKDLPRTVQIVASSFAGIILYIIPGYLFIVSQKDNEPIIKNVDRLMAILSLILVLVFIASFAYAKLTYSRQGWLVYASANPVSGLLIYNLFNTSVSWWDLFWVVSAFVPAIGMILGMYLRLKREGAVR